MTKISKTIYITVHLKKCENIFGDDWAKYYAEISSTDIPRDAMVRPHAHHKAQKKDGKAAGALSRQILQEVNINPQLSRHNLTWAPNVIGQHGVAPQTELLKIAALPDLQSGRYILGFLTQV